MLSRLGWSDDTPVVGFLGRFVAAKGLRVLMQALDGVREPWRALFVGGGPMADDLTAFADAHPGRVRVLTGVGARRRAGAPERDGSAVRAEPDDDDGGASSSAGC